MLTDDDLTRELGEAFRGATTGLTYNGRTAPRRLSAGVPVAAAGGVLAAGAIVAVSLTSGSPQPVRPTIETVASAKPPAVAKHRMVTETMNLAGFTVTYQRAAGEPDPVVATVVNGGLPSGVREIATPGTKAKAWVGKDPKSGDNALYVKAPTRNGGFLFALLSPTWTQRELIHLFRTGTRGAPRAVPEVPAASVPSKH